MNDAALPRARETDSHPVVPPEGRLVAAKPHGEACCGWRERSRELSERRSEVRDGACPLVVVEQCSDLPRYFYHLDFLSTLDCDLLGSRCVTTVTASPRVSIGP